MSVIIIRGWFSTRSLGNKKKIELICGKSKRSGKWGYNGANSLLVTGWQRQEGSPPAQVQPSYPRRVSRVGHQDSLPSWLGSRHTGDFMTLPWDEPAVVWSQCHVVKVGPGGSEVKRPRAAARGRTDSSVV